MLYPGLVLYAGLCLKRAHRSTWYRALADWVRKGPVSGPGNSAPITPACPITP
jgi:hypothetical protein